MARTIKAPRGFSLCNRRECVVVLALVLFLLALVFSSYSLRSKAITPQNKFFTRSFRSELIPRREPMDVSVIVLTYNKSEYIPAIASSLFRCKIDWSLQLIIADNGCYNNTISVVNDVQNIYGAHRVRRIAICTNKRYADANNFAAKASDSKWLLFLNDDVIPEDSFLGNMKSFLELMSTISVSVAAVAPKLLFPSGRVIEAGSIVRSDGSTDNFYRFISFLVSVHVALTHSLYLLFSCLMFMLLRSYQRGRRMQPSGALLKADTLQLSGLSARGGGCILRSRRVP